MSSYDDDIHLQKMVGFTDFGGSGYGGLQHFNGLLLMCYISSLVNIDI